MIAGDQGGQHLQSSCLKVAPQEQRRIVRIQRIVSYIFPYACVALVVEMSTSTKEEIRDKSDFATRSQIALFRLYVRRLCSQYTLPLTLSKGSGALSGYNL
jgi:L-cystine uptake protein TcyP (sodium:dicarboxylate symporter family)